MRNHFKRLTNFCRNAISSAIVGSGSPTMRRRRTPSESFSSVPADVQVLESRKLLTVTFQGGLLGHVEAQGVYLGSDFATNSALYQQTGQTEKFLSTIVNSAYMDTLTQAGYNVGRGTASAGTIVNVSMNKSAMLTDAQIHGYLQNMISHNQLQAPDANRLYVVYTEPGVVVSANNGFSSPNFKGSGENFLGYHGAFAGTNSAGQAVDIHYAVIAYPGAPNYTASSQGFNSNFDQMTSVTSHELGEAATDPNVNYKTLGWYDKQHNAEIGDMTGKNRTTLAGNGVTYVVQELANKNDQPMPLVAVQNLTAPQVQAKATSATTASLSWNSVSGAQGYRLYYWNGTQAVLLGSYNASTTSLTVSGLPRGSTSYFYVEAFNATQAVDSGWVGVTTPR